mgnify:CR=1 FL=1
MSDCDYLIAGAAMIGGISYFHEFEYDLLSENEKKLSNSKIEVKNVKKVVNLLVITIMECAVSNAHESLNIVPMRIFPIALEKCEGSNPIPFLDE